MGTRIASLRTKEVPCAFAHHRWFLVVSPQARRWGASVLLWQAESLKHACAFTLFRIVLARFSHRFLISFSSAQYR